MKAAKTVDEFILQEKTWQEELIKLRKIALKAGLSETIKWGGPVYVHNGKNIIGIAPFKNYVALWFYQGALLKDEKKKLINAQEGITKALRQWRFNSMDEIDENLILEYINESVQNLEKGNIIKAEKKPDFVIPAELESEFSKNEELLKNFYTLSSYKQREYVEYIEEAKREETKLKRLEKIIPIILDGRGLNDKYK